MLNNNLDKFLPINFQDSIICKNGARCEDFFLTSQENFSTMNNSNYTLKRFPKRRYCLSTVATPSKMNHTNSLQSTWRIASHFSRRNLKKCNSGAVFYFLEYHVKAYACRTCLINSRLIQWESFTPILIHQFVKKQQTKLREESSVLINN